MSSSKTIIAKYEKDGSTFEVFVDSDLAQDYIQGKITDPMKPLEVEEIFKDAKKGERQSSEKIKKAFGTEDISKIMEVILKKGDIPLTTEQKNRLMEEKRKQIVSIIARNSIDPRTNAPNPPIRVENALKEAKVPIDPFKSPNEQIDEVVKKLSAIMPIKFTTAKIDVIVPAEYASRCYGILKQYGIKSEKWLSNGSIEAVLEFPAGMQSEFFDRINKATQGKVETKMIEN
ncbi:MAG TPA: ribosome assembly factor SBDS [Candidatus Acidoferrum sp.]|nr:ribosome assembly factor SBDS [Candidatus Acidoferrum sp.]